MKIIKDLVQGTPEWHEARLGVITGSKLKDIVILKGKVRKLGSYKLVADALGIDDESESTDAMSRGHELEPEARELFEKKTGKKVEEVGFIISSENKKIGFSPDGIIDNDGKYTEAVEIKCLSAERHIKAIIENKIPVEYKAQYLQYFIVMEELETLHFIFFDPRITVRPYHCIEVHRWQVEADILFYKEYQEKELIWVEEQIQKLKLAF